MQVFPDADSRDTLEAKREGCLPLLDPLTQLLTKFHLEPIDKIDVSIYTVARVKHSK
jgi:hypothetical protein